MTPRQVEVLRGIAAAPDQQLTGTFPKGGRNSFHLQFPGELGRVHRQVVVKMVNAGLVTVTRDGDSVTYGLTEDGEDWLGENL